MTSILVVCTGNICRSPMAEGFLRRHLDKRGLGAVDVGSAGTYTRQGAPPSAGAIRAAAERGVDISTHPASPLLREDIEVADLVLGMAAEHREAVRDTIPEADPRTFTLKELVRLLDELPPADHGDGPAGDRLERRLAEADELRRSGFEGNPLDEDIADPLGMTLESYRAVAWQLDELCGRMVDEVFGQTRASATAGSGE